MTDTASLADRLRHLIVQVEGIAKESEDRARYREEHGRQLSEAHRAALQGLHSALEGLSARVAALVAPPVDVAALRLEFDALVARLRGDDDGTS